jgi:hypothetical protein
VNLLPKTTEQLQVQTRLVIFEHFFLQRLPFAAKDDTHRESSAKAKASFQCQQLSPQNRCVRLCHKSPRQAKVSRARQHFMSPALTKCSATLSARNRPLPRTARHRSLYEACVSSNTPLLPRKNHLPPLARPRKCRAVAQNTLDGTVQQLVSSVTHRREKQL